VWLPLAVGVGSGLLLLATGWTAGFIAVIPLAVSGGAAASVLAGWPATQPWLTRASVLAAVVSLAATASAVGSRPPFASGDDLPYIGSAAAGFLGLFEVAGLLVLLGLVVRTAPRRTAVGLGLLLTGTSLAWLLRVPPPPTLAAGLATILVWFAGPIAAGIAGGYPRLAEARRQRSVEDARRAQRLHLAGDLHDFVAHDLTGIVVQAQSAQHLGSSDPAVALGALRRIEAAGLHALASMDQALEVLRNGDGPLEQTTQVSIQDLAALLNRFTVASGPTVEAHLDESAWRDVPTELTALVYRVLAEALTNIRRHAPATTPVVVTLGAEGDRVALTVANQLSEPAQEVPPLGGRGLSFLATLVADAGGALTAGPKGDEWRLRLIVPSRQVAER
jgi:signal transduction histidine kinase